MEAQTQEWLLVQRDTCIDKGIEIKTSISGYRGLYSTKSFKKGQIVYNGFWQNIPNTEGLCNWVCVISILQI
jgi:hypothetical protein